ncbi:L,D-transpeptidase family protein [Chelativorans sp. AA-79]|uniref:L,D-transpeptidase family protein n=1 Tax=Chelativorans sp. AA-79 TaxID=3028735 RepID=UPI0023F759F8|nr:L,D-transpeptidase family protein [Chelativorans sp. AA-79]WEX07231.1 L,D-transpeptidase family protein [Chelativorans sp. AA-79]
MTKTFLGSGLSTLALTAALLGSTSPAGAERYLFDILFGDRGTQGSSAQMQQGRDGGWRNAVPQRNVAPGRAGPEGAQRAVPQRQTPPAAQIAAPRFHDFAAPPLARVDFAGLTSAVSGSVGDDAASSFIKALDGLSGFELLAEKKIAAALVEYYAENPHFIWVDESGPNERADKVLDVLGNADSFGLSHVDYAVHVPLPADALVANPDDRMKALVRFEMALTARVLRYARDAKLGRLDPDKLSGYHDFPTKRFDEKTVLQVLAYTAKPVAYLHSLHPQNELFAALGQELKTLRAEAGDEIAVARDTFVRPGGSHPEFSKILRIIERDADDEFRAEHGALLVAHLGSETYAKELVPIIKAAQRQHNLKPDGIVGSRTVNALAGESKAERIQKVLLSMERLRWHPSYLGSTRVMINAPSFTASYSEDGVEKLSMNAVVGKPSSQTYFFHDEIEYVEFNPYWGVPRSIIVNEMLPKLRRDPGYLDRAGYEVIDPRGKRVSSTAVNWSAYGANVPYGVRQPPGSRNALGELKIMFPNSHDIYMHDTPEKSLFSRASRAYSHGCVRLEDPRAMAAAVLRTTVDDVAGEVRKGRNMRRDVPSRIPVYVGYFTAWPGQSGSVSYYDDIYERDAHLRKALAKVEAGRRAGADPLLVAPEGWREKHEDGKDLQAAEQHTR